MYDLEHGDRIDPEAEGISAAGCGGAPSVVVNGKEKYSRLFVRLKTPAETLTCRPIRDEADFAQRVAIIENWFRVRCRNRNVMLSFEALEMTNEDADSLEEQIGDELTSTQPTTP